MASFLLWAGDGAANDRQSVHVELGLVLQASHCMVGQRGIPRLIKAASPRTEVLLGVLHRVVPLISILNRMWLELHREGGELVAPSRLGIVVQGRVVEVWDAHWVEVQRVGW